MHVNNEYLNKFLVIYKERKPQVIEAIKKNKIYSGIAAVLLVVCFALLIKSCGKEVEEPPMVQKMSEDTVKLSDEAIENLKLEKVVEGDFPEKLTLMGKISVTEDRTVNVPSRVGGRIDSIFVASGEVVKEGQPLCSVFSADFSVAREEYLQSLRDFKAHPKDEDAKHMLDLSKKKLNALGVSKNDYDRWVNGDTPKSENILVRAPRAGALLGKNAVIGNLVNVGDSLFTIGDLSKVWFAGDIYPEDLSKIHSDQEVEIEPGNGAPPLHGKVMFISPAMDPNTRTIKIRAMMDNPGNQLRADMYVQGYIVLSRRTAIIAPKDALVRLEDLTFVFKRLPGNLFKKVAIVTSGESTKTVSVSSGLEKGDEVVTEGGLLLDAALHGEGT
jgi:multidrug efflux pump subunit AcrA (membrane-fusion protein)